jgi:hypothetical protein
VRISIQPHGLKDGKPFDAVSFDIQQLELVESPPTTMDAEHAPAMPGGPMPDVERAQDPVTRL